MLFLFRNLDMAPRNSAPGGFAIKTERTQINFLSDVLCAVASLNLKVPNTLQLRARSFNERARPTRRPGPQHTPGRAQALSNTYAMFSGRTGRSHRRPKKSNKCEQRTRSDFSTSQSYFVRSKVERHSIVTRNFGKTLYSHFGEPLRTIFSKKKAKNQSIVTTLRCLT